MSNCCNLRSLKFETNLILHWNVRSVKSIILHIIMIHFLAMGLMLLLMIREAKENPSGQT